MNPRRFPLLRELRDLRELKRERDIVREYLDGNGYRLDSLEQIKETGYFIAVVDTNAGGFYAFVSTTAMKSPVSLICSRESSL